MSTSKRPGAKEGGVPPPIFLKTTQRRSAIPINGLAKTKSKGGAPRGNSNALKHGRYTCEMRARQREIRMLIHRVNAAIAMARACIAYPAPSAPVAHS